MENLKIRVNNEEESKEAQELFSELGYKKYNWSNLENYPIQINAASKNMTYSDFRDREDLYGVKKVTLPELHVIVSLHKNPINMDKVLNEVRSDALGLLEDKPMKEWLNTKTYEYKKAVDMGGHNKWIEIPEGAETAILCSENNIYFWKSHFFTGGIHKNWINMESGYDANWYLNKCDGSRLLWQRHTQPEELPFVDDEPKYDPEDINLAIGYDLDELAKEYGYRERCMHESDLCYRESLKIFIERKPNQTTINAMNEADTLFSESLNDQYAEIEQVRQASIADTLNERQSTYGSFEDVANTTQYLLQMLSTDAMSDVQLEALHMICSKLARITHGDPNYKDNWHDIAGYATLVERSL